MYRTLIVRTDDETLTIQGEEEKLIERFKEFVEYGYHVEINKLFIPKCNYYRCNTEFGEMFLSFEDMIKYQHYIKNIELIGQFKNNADAMFYYLEHKRNEVE